MSKEITLKRCPICGSHPEHQVDDMGTGSYQHYYGAYNYIYKCPKCGMLHVSRDTVYIKTGEEADRKAKQAWNAECDKWEKTLAWRKDRQPETNPISKPEVKEQTTFVLEGDEYYRFSDYSLREMLHQGWQVVNATPIVRNIGGASSTDKIIYILERAKKED